MSPKTITINPITRLEGQMPLQINIYNHERKLLKTLER